jgi:hypothetical protein
MSLELERLYSRGAELRALGNEDDEDDFALDGYAATWDGESEDLGGFRERCMPTAFTRALNEGQDVRCLRNHNPDFVLGRTKNRTLQLRCDNTGLHFRCLLDPKNPEHRSTHASVRRGDIDSCSFAFVAKQQRWEDATDRNGNRYALRLLDDVDLQDCSVVCYPAYTATSVQARSALLFPNGQPVEVRSAVERFKTYKTLHVNEDGIGRRHDLLRRVLS